MKDLIKYYDSNDLKLADYQFADYGSFNSILSTIVAGNGFNDVLIASIERIDNAREVIFTFDSPDDYGYKINDVINIQGDSKEFVITEVDDYYINCTWYDNSYIVNSDADFYGYIVNSSLGFQVYEEINGKLVINDLTQVAKYTFWDVESSEFTNVDGYRYAGVHMTAYTNSNIVVPSDTSLADYNNLSEWYTEEDVPKLRRYITNLYYKPEQRYIIIGNSRFFYFITGDQLYPGNIKWNICSFGSYKCDITGFTHNALLTVPCVNNDCPITDESHFSNLYELENIIGYQPQMLYDNITTSDYQHNTIVAYNGEEFISDHRHCNMLLSGVNGISHYTHVSTGPVSYSTPGNENSISSYDNHIRLGSVKIVGSLNQIEPTQQNNQIIYGTMPFMYWNSHPESELTPDLEPFTVNENGEIRRFIPVRVGNTPFGMAVIETTPNYYNN